MNPDFAVELIRLMMLKASQIAVPILATGMIIGAVSYTHLTLPTTPYV